MRPRSRKKTAGEGRRDEIDLAGRRVLLVEDNAINAEIATMILEQYGVVVDRAEDGRACLEMAQRGRHDLILMDIQMPEMNGYEATKRIRALEGEYYRAIPIIAMSANAYDEDVRSCMEAGMNAHIAKPFNPADLMSLLQEYISQPRVP